MGQEVYDIVFNYERIKDHLAQNPGDRKKIIKFVDEIKGDYQISLVGAMAKFLDQTFMRLYNGINLELPPDLDIKKLQEKYHLILVPNHQSHADYIALQYIFYKHGRIPVYVAGGINLNIFPIGDLFRRCGAFFIRRKFDNELYKITFQAYLYYLLKTDKVVEFFFEGGRTRTGKLLPPKYGLFSMLLDAHTKFDDDKPLMFIPVSIAHEMIPEENAHAKELSGKKKVAESSTQLFKLYKLFGKKLGTVHVKLNPGIVVEKVKDLKRETQDLAFQCFRAVGKGMPVTPSSLLALILLDEPAGILTWKQIENRARDVVDYCQYLNIPMTATLKESLLKSLQMAMDMFISNNKVKVLNRQKLGQVFYSVEEESRVHLLYHKNMILHHFIVPGIVNATWFNIFNGNIKSESDLTRFLLQKRKELKYEFYLPSVKEMIEEALRIVEYAVKDSQIESLGQALKFRPEQLYAVATSVRRFSTAFSYIYEAYYTACITLKYLNESNPNFTEENFLTVSRELFELEREHGRVVKYPESYSVPKMKVTLEYFRNLDIIKDGKEKDSFEVVDIEKINYLIQKFAKDINDQVAINLKFGLSEPNAAPDLQK